MQDGSSNAAVWAQLVPLFRACIKLVSPRIIAWHLELDVARCARQSNNQFIKSTKQNVKTRQPTSEITRLNITYLFAIML